MTGSSSPSPTPAGTASTAPEAPFQAYTRGLDLRFQATIPTPGDLDQIVREMHRLIETIPDPERNHACADGSWSDINLMLPQGDRSVQLTPEYAACPALVALIDGLGGPTGACTLARIPPGDLLDWHFDPVSADAENVRLHLPIETDPAAVTDFCHERVHWPVGRLYYGDYGFPHRVFNTGTRDRLHLYFDVAASSARSRLPEALTVPRHAERQHATMLWMSWKQDPTATL